jgi:hypothetical protein
MKHKDLLVEAHRIMRGHQGVTAKYKYDQYYNDGTMMVSSTLLMDLIDEVEGVEGFSAKWSIRNIITDIPELISDLLVPAEMVVDLLESQPSQKPQINLNGYTISLREGEVILPNGSMYSIDLDLETKTYTITPADRPWSSEIIVEEIWK